MAPPVPHGAVIMRIQIASDMHLEMRQNQAPAHVFQPVRDRDLLILAGDISTFLGAREFVLGELERSPVIYVPGNHEYYSQQDRAYIDGAWRELAAAHPDLHYLVAESVTIGSVRCWGAPWYTDFWGEQRTGHLRAFEWGINDFHYPTHARWRPIDHMAAHAEQTHALRQLAGALDVVVTHWPPTMQAIHPRYAGDSFNPYFVNADEELVREIGARLWVSGHTHEAYDYQVGATRCVGNPAGYPHEKIVSGLFRPDMVVEVPPDSDDDT